MLSAGFVTDIFLGPGNTAKEKTGRSHYFPSHCLGSSVSVPMQTGSCPLHLRPDAEYYKTCFFGSSTERLREWAEEEMGRA